MKKLTEWKPAVVLIGIIVIFALAAGRKAQLQQKAALQKEKAAAHEAGDDGIPGKSMKRIDAGNGLKF
jgi:hypothetical protein